MAKWLAIFSENYRQPVGEMLPEIWLVAIAPKMTIERFESACLRHLETETIRFPTVADILIADATLRRERPVRLGEMTESERRMYATFDEIHRKNQRRITEGENGKAITKASEPVA